jgi:FixJ family two-component response regulator
MICVVDDDISVLRSVQELLASDGLEAQTFDDPEKFLDYARTHNVKLAVLDYAMPALKWPPTAGSSPCAGIRH